MAPMLLLFLYTREHFYILILSAHQKEGLLAPRPKSGGFLNVARLAELFPASRTTCRLPAPHQSDPSPGIPTNLSPAGNQVT